MILVTGGAGYVGSHFVRLLLSLHPRRELVIVDNLVAGHKEALPKSEKVHFVKADVGDTKAMEKLFRKFPIKQVVHFAGFFSVGESEVYLSKYLQNNVVASFNLFQAMDNAGIKQIVFSSSCSVYGIPDYLPLDENHPTRPLNNYGLTKLMVEQALSAYAKTRGWRYLALRYFNASGADASGDIGESHSNETHLIPLVLESIINRKKKRHPLEIYGTDYDTKDGTCVRDYVHVNDLARAHYKALQLLEKGPVAECVNLGTTTGTSVLEIVKLCEQASGKKVPVKYSPRRPGDPKELVANADKAATLLGWHPEIGMKESIQTAWNWHQKRPF